MQKQYVYNNNIYLEVLREKEEKERYRNGLISLFAAVFNRRLTLQEWRHFFLDSPYEEAILILVFHLCPDGKDTVIGSANLIPQRMDVDNSVYRYFLFTTSMIHPEYRDLKLYIKTIDMIKDILHEEHSDFILAFPNDKSYPLLIRLCGFIHLFSDDIIKIYRDGFCFDSMSVLEDACSISLNDDFFKWRFAGKPYFYSLTDEKKILLAKDYKGGLDIIEVLDPKHIDSISRLLPFSNIETDYFYCLHRRVDSSGLNFSRINKLNTVYYSGNKDIDLSGIDVSLLMSDVF